MRFFISFIKVKMLLPNDTTNDIMYYYYTKKNFVASRSMTELDSPSSIWLNEAWAISLIYLQVVSHRGRKHRKTIKWKAEIQKELCQRVFRKTVLFQSTVSAVKMFYSKTLDICELVNYRSKNIYRFKLLV